MNVARARAELAKIETADVKLSKPQYEAMLGEIERGQQAERLLINVRSQLNAAGEFASISA
ncbi:hypothetical protein [Sphingomonas bacterium]|uniref:hypothetical protein n=1 Tax=Sphingomonas bacterium TaxID=1895847 RepID=UPI0015761DE7|nr:hypothetical protein [Sphingomonas bacterium]